MVDESGEEQVERLLELRVEALDVMAFLEDSEDLFDAGLELSPHLVQFL